MFDFKNWKPDTWFSIVYVVISVVLFAANGMGYVDFEPSPELVSAVGAIGVLINVFLRKYVTGPYEYRNGWHAGYAASLAKDIEFLKGTEGSPIGVLDTEFIENLIKAGQ